MLGLDWVVGEVGSRVYYGSQNQAQALAPVSEAKA